MKHSSKFVSRMIFTNKSTSSSADSASSSFIATNKKKNSHQNPVQDELSSQISAVQRRNASMIRLKIQSMGPICKSRRKIEHSSLRISNEEDQLAEEGWPNDHTDDSCMWLSSGTSSPSCCFDDKIFRNFLELSLDDWLVSVLILSEKSSSPHLSRGTSFFDGSSVNPLEEASFVLQRASSFEEEFLEEEITTWLMNSLEAEEISGEVCDHSLYSSKGNFEFLPDIWDIQEGILESLVDLEDGEISDWISDTELNFLQTDFPSPFCNSSWSSDVDHVSQSSDFLSSIEYFAEPEGIDEPIFWPSVQKFNSSLDFSWHFFIMSPRKMMIKFSPQNSKTDMILGKKHVRGENDVKLIKNAPNQPMEMFTSFLKEDFMGDNTDEYFELEETVYLDKHFMFLEEEFPVVQELPIEKLLGLDEFDGHEGIEFEFNKDSLFIDESLEGIFL